MFSSYFGGDNVRDYHVPNAGMHSLIHPLPSPQSHMTDKDTILKHGSTR